MWLKQLSVALRPGGDTAQYAEGGTRSLAGLPPRKFLSNTAQTINTFIHAYLARQVHYGDMRKAKENHDACVILNPIW